jgi:hypothetical protein
MEIYRRTNYHKSGKSTQTNTIFPEGLYWHTVDLIVHKASEIVTSTSKDLLAYFDI